jgi:hypothetical protein
MRVVLACGALLLAVVSPVHGQSYQPAFRPEALKGPPAGRLNDVLVVGSTHLSEASAAFKASMLAPLLDRLAAWRPTAIATEDMSGLECDALRRYPSRYAETVRTYCTDPIVAGRATGLDVPTANAEAERLLSAWPATPAPTDRRHLAAVFMAAGERNSAYVQWLRLPEGERHAGDGLNDDLVAALTKLGNQRSESIMIGATLAARLGLERVWSVDDHSADTPDDPDPAVNKAYGEAISKAWSNPFAKARDADESPLNAGLTKPGGVLDLYRAHNASGKPMQVFRADFGAALVEPSPQHFGRNYVGYWETRNLRMVSNIRDILGRYPGTRLLAIVGASHKGYYEAYLNEMHDVRLVDAETVLK